ncbi:DUF5313 family protein [Nocardia donostiensis]|uniref:DUF5313 domain-containing protein n=1 Tax=Nocardia donostiensis TaxID=1538463 RepID=A0A1W0AXY0_9NOCA|nr:DUF5313 family protein [Nocardia donostiensis]ONM47574.1 hypothetical protein B0T46_16880 [Nocardia donostiensis]OQS15082.1 hypothetical protein B0T36_10420 [Nocardia donostiensis]OQS24255.1 hypothetical protein B0T44_01155 [Nocardia donostiensis]
MAERKRPNPIQWIGYACGRRLPDSMSDWVRNDLTGKYATPRHMVRGMVPLTPIFAAFLLFPGPLWLRGAMILLAVLLGLFYCVAYMPMNREHRLIKHGLPPDLQNPDRVARRAAERAAYEAKYPRTNT